MEHLSVDSKQFIVGLVGLLLILLVVRFLTTFDATNQSAEIVGSTVGIIASGVLWGYVIWWVVNRYNNVNAKRTDPRRFVLIFTVVLSVFAIIVQVVQTLGHRS